MREQDRFLAWGSLLVVLIAIFCALVLDPLHKKNIEKLRITKLPAQHYILNHCDPVWFYKPDEIGWTKGEVTYLWGYHPVIYVKDQNKTFQFHEVEWITRYE